MRGIIKKLILIMVIVSGLGISVWYYPVKINKVVNTSIYKLDDMLYELPVAITIQGAYHRRFLQEDFFEGKMAFDIFTFSDEWEMRPIKIYSGGGSLDYITFDENDFNDKNDMFRIEKIGYIWGNSRLEKFVIIMTMHPETLKPIGSLSKNTSFCIGYPADNREEIIDLIETFGIFEE